MSEARATESWNTESIDPLTASPSQTVAPVEANTPGSVLRRCREARGQSIADVVQVIRFSPRQIEALERDDYASLPGATVTRGLVRNYAKFLKLDPAPLLAQLEPVAPVVAADVRPPGNMGHADQGPIVERVSPGIIAAGVAAILLLLAVYWYSRLPDDQRWTLLLRGDEARSGVMPPSPPPAATAAAQVVAPTPTSSAANEPVNDLVKSEAPPPIGLRVEFDERSWIEIRDATEKVVFVGEYPAGTRRDVEGKAPFQVWIGKASGVRVFMGERSIDLKPYTREEVARFTLE